MGTPSAWMMLLQTNTVVGARQIAFSMLVIFREHKPAILR